MRTLPIPLFAAFGMLTGARAKRGRCTSKEPAQTIEHDSNRRTLGRDRRYPHGWAGCGSIRQHFRRSAAPAACGRAERGISAATACSAISRAGASAISGSAIPAPSANFASARVGARPQRNPVSAVAASRRRVFGASSAESQLTCTGECAAAAAGRYLATPRRHGCHRDAHTED